METHWRTVALGFSLSGQRAGSSESPSSSMPCARARFSANCSSCTSFVSQMEGHSCRARKRAAATRASSSA
eukprot:8719741-Pyramimonas_sp.AAC.1